MKIEVSPGDFLDRLTILEIKLAEMQDDEKRANVAVELAMMRAQKLPDKLDAETDLLQAALMGENYRIWHLENQIRKPLNDQDLVKAALAIRKANEERAAIKRQINEISGSHLIEEKEYG